jgi:hypothetical protein
MILVKPIVTSFEMSSGARLLLAFLFLAAPSLAPPKATWRIPNYARSLSFRIRVAVMIAVGLAVDYMLWSSH